MTIAIRGGRILTITRGVVDEGVILIEDGKIRAVGRDVAVPPGTEVIDATGKVVMPGWVESHSHLGVSQEGVRWEGADHNEVMDPITPQLRAIDAIKPEDQGFKDAIEHGITTTAPLPGSANPIGGLGAVVKCHGNTVEEMLLLYPAAMKMALGENPKETHGRERKAVPYSRMAIAGLMREWFTKAQNYMRKKDAAKGDPKEEAKFEKDLKLEALELLLRKKIPAWIHSHTAYDEMTAIRVAEEFGFNLVIQHATEAHKIATELAKRNIPAVCGPLLTSRRKVELRDRTTKTPGILHAAGVKVALTTDHPVMPIKMHWACAVIAHRDGLPEEEALKAVTINAAEIAGVADRVGSIEVGKDADVIILPGHPLDLRNKVEMTLLNGHVVYEASS